MFSLAFMGSRRSLRKYVRACIEKLFEHSVHGYVHNSEAQSSRRVCRDCSGTCICSTLVDMKLSSGHPSAPSLRVSLSSFFSP